MLDTLPVFLAYEDLTWSPNSGALVVARPTAVNAEEEDTAADLWLFDEKGRKCAIYQRRRRWWRKLRSGWMGGASCIPSIGSTEVLPGPQNKKCSC